MSTLFCFGLYQICLIKNKKRKRKKRKKKKRKENTTRSSDPSSSPFNRATLHNLCKPRLLTSYPHFFFIFIFILGIVTGITSRKALLFPSYKSSYFLSFGTDLLRDFYTFLLGRVCPDVDPIRRCGFLIVVSIVIITSWLLATGLDWDGGWNGKVGR